MDPSNSSADHDFILRQYAHLVDGGLDDGAARNRLHDVLGQPALDALDAHATTGDRSGGDVPLAARIAHTVQQLGGRVADAHAALIHSLGEAQVFALDWWRPIRTYLLYIVFLLGVGVLIALINIAFVLPAFSRLDLSLATPHGAAAWLLAHGAVRILVPLLVMAILLVLLAALWWHMRRRIARLEPLGASHFAWLHGRAGAAWQTLLALECAAILKTGGTPDEQTLDAALRLTAAPAGAATRLAGGVAERLAQALRLQTFGAELEWQRRVAWSRTQSQLELARDRLILATRVVFYILIGILVTALYLPIFSVASMVGVH